jgi:type II secretory pathway pseudopilin PulG
MGDAKTWVGQSVATDKLDLDRIMGTLDHGAKELREILQTEKISGLFKMRYQASLAAGRAQKWFKRLSAVAVISTAVSTLTSGLLLYGAGSDEGATASVVGLEHWVADNHTAIVGVQIISLFLSAVVTSVLSSQNYVARWQNQRSRAELLRRQIFNDVLTIAEARLPNPLETADPGNAIAQAFEFFRRYQHELQITFYGRGSVRHARTAEGLGWLTASLAGLAAITGVLGGFGGAALVTSAFLGIAVPILLSAAQSWRVSSRDSDKVAAYQTAQEALETILLNNDAVRIRAALGDAAAVGAYVNSVHLIMSTENDAWRPSTQR